MEFVIKNEYQVRNLIGFRKKLKQNQIEEEVKKILNYFKQNNIEVIGSTINTTHSIENINGEMLIDFEQFFPVNQKIKGDKYEIKEEFFLTNALYTKHKGNPALLNETYREINRYISENKLHQITNAYNVFVKEVDDVNNMEIDIYVGINPNKL